MSIEVPRVDTVGRGHLEELLADVEERGGCNLVHAVLMRETWHMYSLCVNRAIVPNVGYYPHCRIQSPVQELHEVEALDVGV